MLPDGTSGLTLVIKIILLLCCFPIHFVSIIAYVCTELQKGDFSKVIENPFIVFF